MKEFVHLHNHTEYSLLDGFARIAELPQIAKDAGARAVAITDHGNLYGAIKFYDTCQKIGIKPIIGCEFYVADDLTYKGRENNPRYHLILLAKNIRGFHNLMKLSTIGYVEGFYERPRIDYGVLAEHSEGLVCLSGCVAGALSRILLNLGRGDDAREAAKAYALKTKAMFADGDYYIELQNHGIKEEMQVLPLLKGIAEEIGVKTVATNDLHYLRRTDYEAHDVLLCIQTAKDYDDPDRFRFANDSFYYKTYDEMLKAIGDEEALATTLEIADKCNVELKFHEYTIPDFVVPEGFEDAPEYLRDLAYKGLERRYSEITDKIKERAETELNTIISMGFASYYLIVWDFINYAKTQDIPVGPGRGSGVGSIIAYAIGITDVDPLQYDLLFERFLNSSRASMPDFDIDFCSERREEVIDYVRRKYGEDKVSQIITFGTMKKRNAIKSVARVFRIPFRESNALVRHIKDNDKDVHISDLLDPHGPMAVPELIDKYGESALYKKIFDIAMRIEGMPKDPGKHAGGVIICRYPLSEKVPLARNKEDVTTQFDKEECERLGLLKMDFLALKTLTDIKKTTDYILQNYGKKIDFRELGYEDKEVYKMISDGETDAVFQLESGGMKNFIMQLKPSTIEDVIAGVALFRPGPMEHTGTYVHYKQHPEDIKYRHPLLEPILKSTYGVAIYQEQAMRITQFLAGYTLNEADIFRKFIASKGQKQAGPQHAKFCEGCKKNNIDIETTEAIWKDLEAFGGYAFNKSHSTAYALLSYRTAYLKHYFPTEYLCAVLNNRMNNPDDTSKYLRLIQKMNIKIFSPDINVCEGPFLSAREGIYYGLACIKNVGRTAMDRVVEERKKHGKFESFTDFVRRVPSDALNKSMLESLIKGGAFDIFGKNRSTLMANYEEILNRENRKKDVLSGNQMCFDLLLDDAFVYREIPENKKVALQYEKEVLGRYLTGHPLDSHREELKRFSFDTSKIQPLRELDENSEENDEDGEDLYDVKNGDEVTFAGILTAITIKTAKKTGKPWGYANAEDLYGNVEVVFYSNVYRRFKHLLEEDAFLIFTGRIHIGADSRPNIELTNVEPWNLREEAVPDDRILCIRIVNGSDLRGDVVLNDVLSLLSKHEGGGCKVKIQIDTLNEDGSRKSDCYTLNYTVAGIDMFKNEIAGLVGYDNVKLI